MSQFSVSIDTDKDADEKQFSSQIKAMEELTKKLDNGKLDDDMESIWKNLMDPSEADKVFENFTPEMDKIMFEMFFNGFRPLFSELRVKVQFLQAPNWLT